MKKFAIKKGIVFLLLAAIMSVSGGLLVHALVPVPTDGQLKAVSVRETGAVGDGRTDDTAAFRRAITKAKELKASVFVPGGQYRLTDPLDLSGVDLVGDGDGAFPADNDSLPTLLMTNQNQPLLLLKEGSVSGIKINVQCNDSNRNNFKECISVIGNNAVIKNVKIANPTVGIRTAVDGVTGLVAENIFMPTTHQIGVDIKGTKGTVLKNIEMWTPTQVASDFLSTGIGIRSLDNENVYMESCFSFNGYIGFLFEDNNTAVLDNCSADMSGLGVVARGTGNITVTGGTFWTHAVGVMVEGNPQVTVVGAELRANGDAALKVNGGARTTVQACIIRRTMDDRNVPAISVASSPNVTIEGCMIYCKLRQGEGPAAIWRSPSNFVFKNNIINTDGNSYSNIRPYRSTISNNVVTVPGGGLQ